uniref:Homer scaffold protein 3b n=1 Tax=Oryzias sinensis TaxID=183150 RepID=A0A8C7ZGP4_9TELE
MLSEGSMCEINMEAELFTLQDSNAKLVAALQEANSSVEQWKNQLAEYEQETDRLRDQVAELEAQLGHPTAGQPDEEELSRSLEELEALLRAKDQEIQSLQSKKTDVGELEKEKEEAIQRLQDLERRNVELENRVQSAEKTLASNREEQEQAEVEVRRVVEVLDIKIGDLKGLRQSLAKLVD